MKRLASVKPFARAIFDLAKANDALKQVYEDLVQIKSLVANIEDLSELFQTPIIDKDRKKEIVRRVFAGRVEPLTLGLLEAVIDKHAGVWLDEIIDTFTDMVDDDEGRIEALITSAVEIEADTVAALTKQLSRYVNKDVVVKTMVDAKIVGGIIVKIGDTVIDGSIKTQLVKIQDRLMFG